MRRPRAQPPYGRIRGRWGLPARQPAFLAALLLVAACAAPRPAAPPPPPPQDHPAVLAAGTPASARILRVGTSGDYAPFSVSGGVDAATEPQADPNEARARARFGSDPSGFDPQVARAFAAERGYRIEWVRFRWPELLDDLANARFDVAMSGVTVRPERSLAGRFSVPVAETGAVVLVPRAGGFAGLDELDRANVHLAVNRGGHLERAARARFRAAQIDALEDNAGVLDALLAGRADAAVTDTLEAPHWRARAEARPERESESASVQGAGRFATLGPFTLDRKAYLVHPERTELARELDRWLLEAERSGRLAALRSAHFGGGAHRATATPDAALRAAFDERLALMPAVAEAKRRSGRVVGDPEREQRVIEAALTSVHEAYSQAAEPGAPEPRASAVRALFCEQIEAAKAVQEEVLAGPPDPATPSADLAREIRPALLRIGDRIARLLVAREQLRP